MRSLRDAIEYRDDKRQRTVVQTPYEFQDFSRDALAMRARRESQAFASHMENELNALQGHGSLAADQEAISQEAERILAEAERKARELFEKTTASAENLMEMTRERAAAMEKEAREEGYRQGYEEGREKGQSEGLEDSYKEMAEKYSAFFTGLQNAMQSLDVQKEQRLNSYLEEMKDLVLAIAKKVIHVSLETSGEVIKQMILNAAENGRDKQWSKVFISAADASRMKADGIEIEKLLSGFSDRIKVVVNDDALPGSCVVEFPDQIVDSGVDTQLRNIRGLMDDFGDRGDSEVRLAL